MKLVVAFLLIGVGVAVLVMAWKGTLPNVLTGAVGKGATPTSKTTGA